MRCLTGMIQVYMPDKNYQKSPYHRTAKKGRKKEKRKIEHFFD